jgi:hypothetical protein
MEYTITGKTPDTLEEKLAQYKRLTALRDELTGRLQKTEAEKDTVSPKIFKKVQQEYSSRLENVRKQLSPIESDLERDKKQCEDELPRLHEEIRVLEEELAESEFRYRVGEYDRNELTEIQTRLNPDLAEKTELQASLSERLKAINATFGSITAQDEPAPSPESTQADEDEDESESASDGASSSRVTLTSADPLEALSDKGEDKRTGGPENTQGEPAAGSKKETAPAGPEVDPVDEEQEEAEPSFENPQEWIEELGEADGKPRPAAKSKPTAGGAGAKSTPEKDKDDPLSALADPSGEPNDSANAPKANAKAGTKADKKADAKAEKEEVSVGFPNMVIITGPSSGKKIPLLPMTMSIGREHDNNIELKDPDVGRYHARILYDRGRFVLEDLESSNGTWLNGERISEAALKNGDRIKIGETELAIDFD